MTRATRALLNWHNLKHNYAIAKQQAPDQAYAVIKANGYGHGMIACAQALASEADGFAVACMDEALDLRTAGIEAPILVLEGAYNTEEWQQAAGHSIQLAVHHTKQLEDAEAACLEACVSVWLKVNSGMNRLGVSPDDAPATINRIQQNPALSLCHVMSHYATADQPGSAYFLQQQQTMTSEVWPVPLSLSNSAGIIRGALANESVIRPGIMLYGSSPVMDKTAEELGLKPVMCLQSELISIHAIKAGQTVGYGQTWCAERDSLIGVVAIGYGDGYPRHAPSGTPVAVAGHICPLVGRVSMDMITVDLTHVSDGVHIGSPVELWGEQVDVDEVARLAGTISYELYCRLTSRVSRVVQSRL